MNDQAQIVFQNCPIIVVDQINFIQGFLPKNATVESIKVPVFCEKCDREFIFLKSTRYLKESIDSLIYDIPGLDCESFPHCKKFLEIDFLPEASLKFLED